MEHPHATAHATHRDDEGNDPRRALEGLSAWQRRQETARLMTLLGSRPEGLTKPEILEAFYEDYARSSPLRKSSLEVRLNKLLQRSRRRIRLHGADVAFDRLTRRWRLVRASPTS